MKVISTNTGKATTIRWKGREVLTGIYKYPEKHGIELGSTDVVGDVVVDRKNHSGPSKACYLFSSDQYAYWRTVYPQLSWEWGMFGENLTVEGLDETTMRIGNIYTVGTATVQVSQPREPCYKLGIRFGSQAIIREFVAHGRPGTYARVLRSGKVHAGDTVDLVKESDNLLTIANFYSLLFDTTKDPDLVKMAIENEALPLYKRERLLRGT